MYFITNYSFLLSYYGFGAVNDEEVLWGIDQSVLFTKNKKSEI